MLRSLALLAVAGVTLAACDSNDPVVPVNLDVQTATNVYAPVAAAPPGPPVPPTGPFALYSLRTNSRVANTDSATTKWDLGFRGTDIIVNGGSSGPGQAQAAVLVNTFAEVNSVPTTTELLTDGTGTCSNGVSRAICGGSGNGWYTYTPLANSQGGIILPTAGRTIAVRTADGKGYAKVQIRSYYQNSPEPAAITEATPARYFTFQYVLNPTGRSFMPTL